MAITDGLLGWPGLGQGGSLEWKGIRLNTGDVWFAPKSGYYLIFGAGGGGAGGNGGGGGGSGATLHGFPVYIPEGVGGRVTIGAGGTTTAGAGNPGGSTSLGDVLILGGGLGGSGSPGYTGGASGPITGWLVTALGQRLVSQGTAGTSSGAAAGNGGYGGLYTGNLTSDFSADFLSGRLRVAAGGLYFVASAEAGGGGGAGTANGAAGALAIAWL